jgi:glutamyl-tRNA reductase
MWFCCVGAGLHLEMMAERFINKVLHTPTRRIKHAAGTERERRPIETIRHLFDIGDER